MGMPPQYIDSFNIKIKVDFNGKIPVLKILILHHTCPLNLKYQFILKNFQYNYTSPDFFFFIVQLNK